MLDTQKIKALLKVKRISIVEFAGMIGISKQGVYDLFNTKSTKVDTLEKIANALQTPICEFFDTPQHTVMTTNTSDGHKIELLEKEVKHLKLELEMKDKIIKLLEGKG